MAAGSGRQGDAGPRVGGPDVRSEHQTARFPAGKSSNPMNGIAVRPALSVARDEFGRQSTNRVHITGPQAGTVLKTGVLMF